MTALESAINLPRKRPSVTAESAFQGAAGQQNTIIGRPRAHSYSNFSGPTINVSCEILKVSVSETGLFTLQNDHRRVATLSSGAGDEADVGEMVPRGSTLPAYGSGLLGIGKSKCAIYIC